MSIEFSNILSILVFLIPGFIARELLLSAFPARKQSTVHTVVWSIVYSFILLIALHLVGKCCNVESLDFILKNNNAFKPLSIVILILSGIVLGVFLIALAEARFHIYRFCNESLLTDEWQSKIYPYTKYIGIPPDTGSIWAEINSLTDGYHAVVFLDDNSIYRGWIGKYTYDPNVPDHDFLLSGAVKIDEDFVELYKIEGPGIYMNTRNVKRIELYK